ncbi:MAG: Ig-like domain-containing protein [Clostridia bacterium]|nr:Ig-like domain-containing protein [Clostridia bacterium]
MKSKKQRLLLVGLIIVLCLSLGIAIVAAASTDGEAVDAMVEIESNLAAYKIGDTATLDSDGYIGIPMEISVYFDKEKHTAVPDYMANGGTPVIIYVVNTMAERVGTDSDTKIITSMLERGYIVTVFDYLNNSKAVSPDLDWSAQLLRSSITTGTYFDNSSIPEGEYPESFVAPAGCNVSLGNVFWEADKHGADGTLEKIVETWNNDFRSYKEDVIVKWTDSEGNRKSTANGINDGSAPVWYTDAEGKFADTDGTGEYIKVMHTWANDIFDCVNPDGTPVDLNLYINIVYPTSPENAVPVVSLANSSTFPTSGITSADKRPHTNGFLFNGYASAVFDYLWEPMARMASYGYFDGQKGNGGYTGDQMNYSLHIYNDKRIYTAAMRYLRYLNDAGSATYNFNEDAFGVYGNSKGGWFTFLGSAELHDYTEVPEGMTLEEAMDARINEYTSKREFPNHAGETYYQNGKTEDTTRAGITVDGGELQPWLTYSSEKRAGEEILAYANVLYACCGPAYEDMDIGGAPIFITSNLYDDYQSAWGSSNIRTNLARALDTPSLQFESPVGHMLTHSKDITHGVDTYDAFFDFFGYYLKGESVKVVYTTPRSGDAGISFTGDVVIKFIGSVSADEIAKVTVCDPNGNTVSGKWSSLYGNTEWTFTPSGAYLGNTTYKVTVPASLVGDNGTTLGTDYVMTFTTEYAEGTAAAVEGKYITATVPASSGGNSYSLYFGVANDAANVAGIYAVADKSSTDGEYLGSVNLYGSGFYSVDVTDYLLTKNVGDEVIFYVKAEREAGESETFRDDFAALGSSGYTSGNKSRFGNYVRSADSRYAAGEKFEAVTFDGESAVKFIVGMNGSRYPNVPEYEYDNEFYARTTTALFSDNIINNGNTVTKADYGRKYTVTVRMYDTVSRDILFYIESASGVYLDNVYDTMDYNQSIKNVNTKAGEWVEFTLEYTVHESDFGIAAEYEPKRLIVDVTPEGRMENGSRVDCPIYIDYISVVETVTDISISNAGIAELYDGGYALKAPVNTDKPIALYSGDTLVSEHASWSEALAAYVSGYTVTLNADYTLTDSDNSEIIADFEEVNIDLNGYKLTAKTSEHGPIWLKADAASSEKTVVNVYGGTLYFADAPVVSYEGSVTAAQGREFDVSFTGVVFGIVGRTAATSLMSSTESDVDLSVNIAFDGCLFNIGNENLPYLKSTLFGKSDALSLSYTLTGGRIKLDSERWLNIVNSLRSVTFETDSEGNYTSLIMPTPYTADASVGYLSADGVVNYSAESNDGYFTTNTLKLGELSTKYGVIPEEYASAEDYPTVIFDKDGNFVKAYATFHGPLNYFATYSTGDEWFMVLRRDFDFTTKFDNLSKGNGTITVDLGGHTVTCNGVMLYNADAKTNGDVTVNTVNGTVLVTTLGAVRILGWDTEDYDTADVKNFDFNFENIKFGLADGATTAELITYNYERSSSAAPANNAMTFTDCTFDISGAAAETTIFTVGNYNGGKALTGTYKINGGKIIADNAAYLNVYELVSDTGSSIRFNKNESGEYVKVVIPTGSALPADAFISDNEGAMKLAESGTEGDNIVYTLELNNLLTKYGTISLEYASAEDYPWVVFDKNGNCVGGGKLFTTTVGQTACAAGDGSVILLRRDFNMDTDAQASGSNSFSTLNGKMTVDLGGYTLTMGAGGKADAFIRCEAHIAGYKTEITVTNGKIIAGADPIVRYASIGGRFSANYATESATNPHSFYVTLDKLNVEAGSAAGKFLFSYGGASGTAASGFDYKLTVNECNVKYSGTSTSANHTLVASVNAVPISATVIGGTVTDDGNVGKFVLTSMGTGSICRFAKGENGEYITLTAPSGNSVSTAQVNDAENTDITDLKLSEYYVDGSNTVYTLCSLVTDYGTISDSYASLLKYPFVVFDKDGNCTAGGTKFTTTISAAACTAGDGSVILLRRDFNMDTDSQSGAKQSLSTLDGKITVDLGGYTVTMGNGGSADAFIRAEAYACGYKTYITVTNGKFIVGKDPIVRFSAINTRVPTVTLDDATTVAYNENTDMSKVHNFYVTLDGLEFELDSDSALRGNYALLYTQATSGYDLAIHNNNLLVKNCKVDVTNCSNTSARIVASHISIGANVVIEGGSVIFGSTRPGIQGMNTSNTSTFAFDKAEGGNYTSFAFPKSHIKPTTLYKTQSGLSLSFVEISDNGTTVTYRLRPTEAASIDFVPKMSLTLARDLVLNVYVPAADFLAGFTLDGAEYTDFTGLKQVTVDNETFYLISIPLSAKEAARNVTLKASVTVGEKTATATFTFGIIKYAEKILADGSAVEKTLVCDVLSYVRAAYAYFDTDAADVIAKINAILGENYDENNAPSGEGSATAPSTGLSDVTFVLDATPTIRFYLAENANASLYKFYIDGVEVNTVTGTNATGTYIDLDTYAYAVCETVTYTVDGAEGGSFHINAYYEWSKTQNNAELENLVARFMKYSESARAYKDSVVTE